MPVWDFSIQGTVPTEFSTVTGGNGTVSVTGGKLVVDMGGAATTDYAAAVYKTAIDMSKLTVIAVEIEMSGGNSGGFPFPMISFIDSAAEPGAMAQSTFNPARRVFWEDQRSSNDDFDRCMFKFNNPSGTQYQWSQTGGNWTTAFEYSLPDVQENHPYLLTIIIDGTVSPARFRGTVHGYYNKGALTAQDGRQLYWDTTWTNFDTGTTDVDPVDNSLWMVIGNNMNDANNVDWTHSYKKIMIGEIDPSNNKHFLWTNRSPQSSFPFPYVIDSYINPFPESQTYWISRLRDGTGQIARSAPTGTTEDWVKDPYVYDDTANSGYFWMFVNVRKAADSKCYIYTARSTTLLNPTWADWTQISAPGAGESYHSFPWLTRAPGAGDWYLFYGVSKTSPPPLAEIQYKVSSASDPRTGWGSATTIFDPAGSATFDDDGANQPFLVWIDGTLTGGTWLMYYAGVDGTDWRGHYAKSTTGIAGTYTKAAGGPDVDVNQWASTLSANAFNTRVVAVGSTSGLSAGDLIYINGNPKRILFIDSVDSGTQLTLSGQVYINSGTALRTWNYYSIAPRSVIKYGSTWYLYGTVFKFPAGEEYSTLYIDTAAATNPENATWRQIRKTESTIITFLPVIQPDGIASENPGHVWSELSAIVSATTITETFSIDALIQQTGITQTFSIDSVIQDTFSESINIGALLSAIQTGQVSTDAVLQALKSQDVSIDSLLSATKSGQVSADALLLASLQSTTDIDAILTGIFSTTTGIDALLQTLLTQNVSIDSLLQSGFLSTTDIDSLLQATKTETTSLGALLQAGISANVSLDAILSGASTVSIQVDSLLQVLQSSSVSLDAVLVSQGVSTESVSIDALLRDSFTNTASLDSLLQDTFISTAVLDAILQATRTGNLSLDALLVSAGEVLASTSLDSLIQAIAENTVSIDALLQSPQVASANLDAVLFLLGNEQISIDSLLQASKVTNLSIDSLIQVLQSESVSIGALVAAQMSAGASIDAILGFMASVSTNFDSILKATITQGVSLTAILGQIADIIIHSGRVVKIAPQDRYITIH